MISIKEEPTSRIHIRTVNTGAIGLMFVVFFIFSNFGCSEDSPDPGNIEYVLKNSSEVNVGFKVHLSTGADASIIEDSVILKPDEELVIVKSIKPQEPELIIDKIEIWNNKFKSKYKDIDLDEYTKENDRYILTIGMPHTNVAQLIKFNTSVHLYLDETSLFGFYPTVDYPRTTNFFSTTNYFKDIFKTPLPKTGPNANFRIVDFFGSTLIGCDARSYDDKVLFITSNNGGVNWQTFFQLSLSTFNDAFTATDFINENTGWMFCYKTVFNGQYANTYATEIYKYSSQSLTKISTLDNYSIYYCKFIDENTGYVLANTSNNTIPPDTQQTIYMKTSDGGVTWSSPIMISDSYRASKIFRLDNGKLIVPLNLWDPLFKHYMVSTDDGETWGSENIPGDEGVKDLHFLSNGTGYLKTGTTSAWASPNIGDVYKTTNGGTTWTKVKEDINGSIIWFYNENIGYLQDLIYGQGQILYVTTDGGITWKEVMYPYDYLIE